MKCRFLLPLAAFALAIPSLAFAAEKSENTAEARHGVDVIATGAAGASFGKSSEPMVDLEVSGYWKVSPRLAFGAAVGRTWMLPTRTVSDGAEGDVPTYSWSSDTNIWRVAPAARWDYHRSAWTRGWIGGQIGPAFIVDRVATSTTSASPRYLGLSNETRIAPIFAIDAGFALQPSEWVSVGLSVKAFHIASGTTSALGSGVTGPLDGMFAGFVLAVHVPIGPRDPT